MSKCRLKADIDCNASLRDIVESRCIGCEHFDQKITNNPEVMVNSKFSQLVIDDLISRHERTSKGVKA